MMIIITAFTHFKYTKKASKKRDVIGMANNKLVKRTLIDV